MSAFNLSALAVRERAVTLFLIIAIALSGIYAFVRLGRAEDPAFTIKVLTVTVAWPGASSADMQNLVAEPLEKRLQELSWYDRVETMSRPGLTFLTLVLKDSTPPAAVAEQFYQARKKVEDEAPRLPAGVFGPYVNDEYSDVSFALYALKAPGLPPRQLTRTAEDLRQQLLAVPGVKKVTLLGERPERIFLNLSWQKLATLGIGARDIFAALQAQNALRPAGSIDTRGPQLLVRVDGAFTDLEQIKATPVNAGGRSFRLGDIAAVERGYEDPPGFLIRHQGEPALVLSVVMREGWNGLRLGRDLEQAQQHLARNLPLGYSFSKITDQAVNIHEAVNEFMLKFVVALAVVMLVSLLSMGWRAGMIVAAAVPLTLGMVFVIMLLTGRVFDRITLGALIIALGLLVDDAIIAIEMMVVKLEAGMARAQAAAYAWSHTAAPMLAGTLVTIIGFTPVGFAQSSAGEYAGNIFWIVGFALLASWLVAVVFTPYLGYQLLPAAVSGKPHADPYVSPGYQRFRALVAWAIRRKYAVATTVLLLFIVAGAGMALVRQQFFPTSNRPELLVEIQLPKGSSVAGTSAATASVEAWLRQQSEAQVITSYIGQGAPRFFFSLNPELPDPSFAKIVVLTSDENARENLKQHLRARIAEGLAPTAKVRVTQLLFGPPSPFPVAFRVSGPDPEQLRAIAAKVLDVMRANPHTRQANVDWGERTPALHFVLDQERLSQLGLTPADTAQQLQFLLSGVPVSTLREGIRNVDIVARSAGPERLDPARLRDLAVKNMPGRLIPLDQIGHIEVRAEDPLLKRRDRQPTLTVQADIDESLQPPQVSQEIENSLQTLITSMPAGYHIDAGGSIEEANKANAALLPVLPVMVLLTLAVIMVQVRSFSAMFMVFLTAPLGLVGTVPTLLLFHQPFGFNAILGLIGLAGILMRNTLILIGQIATNKEQGLSPYQAVVEATVQRARPVILTALAAVLAFIPLTFSVFFGAMAFTLIGGTAVVTALTLLFLPSLYCIWFGVSASEEPLQTAEHEPLLAASE